MVGAALSSAQVDNMITSLAVNLRKVCNEIKNLNERVNGQGNGLAVLQAAGYSNTANPANPGGVSDAQYALNMISYLNTMSALYFGTATQATTFNFDQELSQMWGGYISDAGI